MSKKGYCVLEDLINKGIKHKISKVISSKNSSVQQDFFDEILNLCEENSINFHERKESFKIDTKYSISVSWRWIINIKKNHQLIVLHDSILPKYRGFIPLVNSLINKEKNIGVTGLFANENYDEGEIIIQKSLKIKYPIKIIDAINLICNLYSEIVFYLIQNISDLKCKKQNNKDATYSLWLNDEDYFVDWNKSADYISRFIDSVGFPYSGAKTKIKSSTFLIISALALNDVKIENRKVGKVIFIRNSFPVVVCGEGLLKILEIKDLNGNNILPLQNFRTIFK